MLLVVGLIGLEHTVKPWEELLGAVVGVENDRDTVSGGNGSDEVGSCSSSGNGSLLISVGETLSTEESGTTLGDLKDDRRLDVSGSLEDGVNDGRGGNVLSVSRIPLGPKFRCIDLRLPKRANETGSACMSLGST